MGTIPQLKDLLERWNSNAARRHAIGNHETYGNAPATLAAPASPGGCGQGNLELVTIERLQQRQEILLAAASGCAPW